MTKIQRDLAWYHLLHADGQSAQEPRAPAAGAAASQGLCKNKHRGSIYRKNYTASILRSIQQPFCSFLKIFK